jgi:hypothetical protein
MIFFGQSRFLIMLGLRLALHGTRQKGRKDSRTAVNVTVEHGEAKHRDAEIAH